MVREACCNRLSCLYTGYAGLNATPPCIDTGRCWLGELQSYRRPRGSSRACSSRCEECAPSNLWHLFLFQLNRSMISGMEQSYAGRPLNTSGFRAQQGMLILNYPHVSEIWNWGYPCIYFFSILTQRCPISLQHAVSRLSHCSLRNILHKPRLSISK